MFNTMPTADDLEARMDKSRPFVHYPDPDPLRGFQAQPPGTLFAMCLFGEARNQGFLGAVLVGMVIRNRMFDPRRRPWLTGKHGRDKKEPTVADVVLNPVAFSCFNPDEHAARSAMMRAHILEPEAWEMCRRAAFDVLEERIRVDFTDGSTHYFNPKITNPLEDGRWKKHLMTRTIRYRDHDFVREE